MTKVTIVSALFLFAFLAKPSVFEKKTLSTAQVETSIALTPDETMAYVTRHNGEWGSRENPPNKIYTYKKEKKKWVSTGISTFSQENTKDSDSDIFISYDGKEAFFVSTRTYEGKQDDNQDIWKSTWDGKSWTTPKPVKEVNTIGYEASPVTDNEGNLYFSSMREGGKGLGDLYVAKRKTDGSYDTPQPLEGKINAIHGEWNLIVSPKADWIIFESSGRVEGLSSNGDLYLSKNIDGEWGAPKHLANLNTSGSELNPRILIQSEKLIFISSNDLENVSTDIYQVPLSEIGVQP